MNKLFYLTFLLILSCARKTTESPVLEAQLHWYHKDLEKDKIPGISLEKFYKENKKTPKSSIIVAVIDTHIDATHPELKDQIWTNTKEIPNNGIDDDDNGYIDDVNGWSFIGLKNGEYVVRERYDLVKIIKEFEVNYMNKGFDTVKNQNEYSYKEYKMAKKVLNSYVNYYKEDLVIYKNLKNIYSLMKDSINSYFTKNKLEINIKTLDSVFKSVNKINKFYVQRLVSNDQDFSSLLKYYYICLKLKVKNEDGLTELIDDSNLYLSTILDVNFKDNYDPYNFPEKKEKNYGNNIINNDIIAKYIYINHSTKVSGILAGNRKDNKGIFGISNQIKIMPLAIEKSGGANDKDIAMAIYYAVDNGAKIINMSFGKDFSVNKQWVYDAIQYAERKNVLIVKIAHNDSYNIDENPQYPLDYNYETQEEIAQNMIVVGATTQKADSTLVASYSNYGKKNVDLFAPGENIYTATYKDKYTTDGGTSLAAPMVSGTAALLWLHYPKLTVQEVKKIILESGTSLDLEVFKPGTEEKVPFSSLSKSGKLLNVYNAMKMAKKY
jgi:cell wall-associated protease